MAAPAPLTDRQIVDAMNNYHTLQYIQSMRPLPWKGIPLPIPIDLVNDDDFPGHDNPNPVVHLHGGSATTEEILQHPYIGPHAGSQKTPADLSEVGRLSLAQARGGYDQFMNERCPHSNGTRTWQQEMDLAIRESHWVVKNHVHDDILANNTLNGTTNRGCTVKESAATYLRGLLVVIVTKHGYGNKSIWPANSTVKSLSVPVKGNKLSATQYGQEKLKREKIYTCFVRPLLLFVLETMIPNGEVTWAHMVEYDVSNFKKSLGKRAKHGFWSNGRVLQMIADGTVTGKECQGCFLPHARMTQLFFKKPLTKGPAAVNYLLDDEERLLSPGMDIDQHMKALYKPTV